MGEELTHLCALLEEDAFFEGTKRGSLRLNNQLRRTFNVPRITVGNLVPMVGLGHFCIRFRLKFTRSDALLKGYQLNSAGA